MEVEVEVVGVRAVHPLATSFSQSPPEMQQGATQEEGAVVVVVANLAPRKLRGEVSQGMLLAASVADGEGERTS